MSTDRPIRSRVHLRVTSGSFGERAYWPPRGRCADGPNCRICNGNRASTVGVDIGQRWMDRDR